MMCVSDLASIPSAVRALSLSGDHPILAGVLQLSGVTERQSCRGYLR